MVVKTLGLAASPTCGQWCTAASWSLSEGPPLPSMKVAPTHCTPLRSGSTSIPPPWQGKEALGEIVGLLAWSFCPGWLGDQGWYITVSLERLPLISPANSSTLSCGYQAPCPVDILQPNLSLCHLEFNKASKDYKHFIITRNHSKWVLEAKTLVSFVTLLHNELRNKSNHGVVFFIFNEYELFPWS